MTMPVPPDPPATVDATTWQAWDIAIRYQALMADNAYKQNYLNALAANTAALVRQAAAIEASAAAQQSSLKALDSYTDAELTAKFMAALSSDWGMAGRGATSVQQTAAAMLAAYRAKFPAPTTP